MLPASNDHASACRQFRWELPERYNIGIDVCDRWAAADPDRVALIHELHDGSVETVTFEQLRQRSNRVANALRARGVDRGDRVAVLVPQSPCTAASHIGAFKAGAIAVPLFSLFGEQALEHRLRDSGARLLVTDADGARKISGIRHRLPELGHVLVAGAQALPEGAEDFDSALQAASEVFDPVQTLKDDPALIIYTSGTTGKSKGALLAHRTLLAHLPGVEMSHGGRIGADAVFWTPADWAWIGGLLDVLMPALHHGVPVVAHRFPKFDAAAAFALMSRHRVTHTFLPPTALKLLRSEPHPRRRWPLKLRSVASGGESLGSGLLDWGRRALDVSINEFYGQTECNMIVSACAAWFTCPPGSMGRAVPGHDVQIVDLEGRPQPAGVVGQIGVRAPDPVMFLGYWNNPAATRDKYAGSFLLTGDTGCIDGDGFLHFVGRDDDVITSAGYRIGPGPIEDCLLGHPAVHQVAVVGMPDEARTEIVKAFVVLKPGCSASAELTQALQDHVRTRLAAHEYPRAIEYLDTLPMTATGKVQRAELRHRGGPPRPH